MLGPVHLWAGSRLGWLLVGGGAESPWWRVVTRSELLLWTQLRFLRLCLTADFFYQTPLWSDTGWHHSPFPCCLAGWAAGGGHAPRSSEGWVKLEGGGGMTH